ncbi:MAG: mercury resistance system transport protein MerF [Rhodospirillales bacterium]|nr:mercury resistance system transport protein MerF [Rhodospirillales bacterium]
MKNRTSLRTGFIGTAVAAICCFTPFLVVLLGAVGLSAWLGWLDYVLFPILFASMGLVAHALYLRAGKVGPRPKGYILAAVVILTALLFWLEFRFALRLSIAAAVVVAAYAYYLRRGKAAKASGAPSEDNKLEQKS